VNFIIFGAGAFGSYIGRRLATAGEREYLEVPTQLQLMIG
jgi:ketopantoate reductase